MNIAVAVLWYVTGYVGCIWAVSRIGDVTVGDLGLFILFSIFGPIVPIVMFLSSIQCDKVVIRRRK